MFDILVFDDVVNDDCFWEVIVVNFKEFVGLFVGGCMCDNVIVLDFKFEKGLLNLNYVVFGIVN